jgi:hypothetical protein
MPEKTIFNHKIIFLDLYSVISKYYVTNKTIQKRDELFWCFFFDKGTGSDHIKLKKQRPKKTESWSSP